MSILFYTKPAKYNQKTLAMTIPQNIINSGVIDRKIFYKVTLEPVPVTQVKEDIDIDMAKVTDQEI